MEEVVSNPQVDQLAKEMTELCKLYANKTAAVVDSPLGKVTIGVILTVLLSDVTPDQFHWWKPGT